MQELYEVPSFNPNLKPFIEFLSRLKNLCDDFITDFTQPAQPKIRIKTNKGKKPRDPDAPKMPKSAFIFYFQEQKDNFLERYTTLNFQDITRLIAEEWKTLSPEQQQHYHKQAEEDRIRYNTQQKEYSLTTNKQFSNFLKKKLQIDGKCEQKKVEVLRKLEDVIGAEDEIEDSFGGDIVAEDSS